jgi:hypothetical protein
LRVAAIWVEIVREHTFVASASPHNVVAVSTIQISGSTAECLDVLNVRYLRQSNVRAASIYSGAVQVACMRIYEAEIVSRSLLDTAQQL